MKSFVWMIFILILACSLVSCSRVKRVANDVNWIVFDGQPSKDN